MRIHHLMLILCCGLVTACGSKDPHFPIEESIAPELMPLQGLTSSTRLEVRCPFLIVQNDSRKQRDSLFHIYDLRNRELKIVFGVRGEGPDEFASPVLLRTLLSDFLIDDYNKNQVYRFAISEEGQPELKGTKQPRYMFGVTNASFINDSLYVLDAMHLDPSLYLLSLDDEFPKKSWEYRERDRMDYYSDPNAGSVFANGSRIVFCYEYKKQIDFMDTEFNLVKRVEFEYPASNTSVPSKDRIAIYGPGFMGKRYFYTLFLGTSWSEFRELSFRETFLEVFDLNGKPVARYHIDGLSPTHFVVDEETFTLYGIRDDGEPEDNLLVYKLKGLS